MDNSKLNNNISFFRKKQCLTQEELAKALGVTNQSVSKWESAQCCPDISLIPKLADIFAISIDELFGRETQKGIPDGNYAELPWKDDNKIRVFQTLGKKILKVQEDNNCIEVAFPKNCNETTRQYFKVEIYGNTVCDASINGDVLSHGKIECNQINGDVKVEEGDITCKGNINGDVQCVGNVTCVKTINGDIVCEGDIKCNIINGDAKCQGDIYK